jgi:hypothetical protein
MLDDPWANFAIPTRGGQPDLNHLGIQAESGAELKEIDARLHEAHGAVVEQGTNGLLPRKSEKSFLARRAIKQTRSLFA